MLFSRAINRDLPIVIESDKLKKINNNLKSYSIQCIIDKIPMRTSDICEILHSELDDIEFIEIMSTAKITRARI